MTNKPKRRKSLENSCNVKCCDKPNYPITITTMICICKNCGNICMKCREQSW